MRKAIALFGVLAAVGSAGVYIQAQNAQPAAQAAAQVPGTTAQQAVSEATAFLLTTMMADVINSGSSAGAYLANPPTTCDFTWPVIGTGGVGPHGGPIYDYDGGSTSETKSIGCPVCANSLPKSRRRSPTPVKSSKTAWSP